MKRPIFTAFLSILSFPAACGSQGPMFQAQVCLGNAENIAAFAELLESLAIENGFQFIDSSDYAYDGLNSLGQVPGIDFPIPVTHLGVRAPDGGGLTASNVGLAPHEVGIGMTPGRDKLTAEAFALRLQSELEARWTVELVPLDEGMFPNPDCTAPATIRTPGG